MKETGKEDKLNHNLTESNATEGETRKLYNIKHVIDIFKLLGKAIRLEKKSNKPRLLKITVDSLESKISIVQNCTNFRKADLSSLFTKVYIIPDLTPAEREANQQLRLKLKEMKKGENHSQNKKWKNSADEGLDPH